MFELHTIYRLKMLNITMMTIMCTLLHTCDKEKRLRFMNPTQINQLELNLVINEKSDTFKGMSKKKRATTIKKSQQKLTKEKRDLTSTHIGQLFQWFEDRQCIMAPYNFK
jgi:3,4-dihydroxy-2-butanone 4-phosphate synthase